SGRNGQAVSVNSCSHRSGRTVQETFAYELFAFASVRSLSNLENFLVDFTQWKGDVLFLLLACMPDMQHQWIAWFLRIGPFLGSPRRLPIVPTKNFIARAQCRVPRGIFRGNRLNDKRPICLPFGGKSEYRPHDFVGAQFQSRQR